MLVGMELNNRIRRRTAYFNGNCRLCGKSFVKGAEIYYQGNMARGSKCSHATCYEQALASQSDSPAPEGEAEDWAPDVAEQALEASAELAQTEAPKPAPAPTGPSEAERAVLTLIFESFAKGLLALAAMGYAAEASADAKHRCYDRLERWVKAGVNRIWITGPAGTGKTHAAEQIAKSLGLPFYVVTPIESRYDGLGYNDAHGRYVETPIYRWAVDPNPRAILLLDEVDGFQPGALIALNAVLANGLGVFPHQQVEIVATKIVIGTANTLGDGPDVKYSGRLAQDASVVDRFSAWLEWGVDEKVEAKIAQAKCPAATTPRAVDVSQQVRRILIERKTDLDWGPRRTYAIAQLMAAGETGRDAVLAAGLMRLPDRDSILSSVRFEAPRQIPKVSVTAVPERFRGKPWTDTGKSPRERMIEENLRAGTERLDRRSF